MTWRFFSFFSLLLFCLSCTAQREPFNNDPMQRFPAGVEEPEYFIREPEGLTTVESRVEPPNWWTGMANTELELLIYHSDIIQTATAEVNHPGVRVKYIERETNPNYLFLGLEIGSDANPGTFPIVLRNKDGSERYRFDYSLAAKPSPATLKSPSTDDTPAARGSATLGPQDLIYLIMPDRFANGDRKNDSVEDMAQTGTARNKIFFRHGGDLMGIMERLDYLEDLGVTALWLNPVLENDQPYESYHGYAVSDHYRIDRRFGTNEQYRQLVQLAHERGIKIIMDVIFNHVGDQHYQIKDIPSKDWIHQWPEYTKTTYRATTLIDPNVSQIDRKLMTDGWFDKHMPDLNQDNPHLARYLIQNSIWWTAYSGQDAFRIDTYAYPDPTFMSEWNRRLLEEFPHLGIYGETWVHGAAVQAWFTGSETLHPEFNTNLPGVTDFQLYYAINEALSQEPGWTDGVMRIYYTLAKDYLYDDPTRNVIFLDNHDLARFYTVVGEDMTKFKSGLALLLSMRGIPMLYYGTEMAFTGSGGAFGEGGRIDFPGGWRRDKVNLFEDKDRNELQREVFDFVRRIATFRRDNSLMWDGDFVQFVPRDGIYVYSRTNEEGTMITLFNGKAASATADLSPFDEVINGRTSAYDLTSGQDITLGDTLEMKGKETRILILR